jgi:hypothetical protein
VLRIPLPFRSVRAALELRNELVGKAIAIRVHHLLLEHALRELDCEIRGFFAQLLARSQEFLLDGSRGIAPNSFRAGTSVRNDLVAFALSAFGRFTANGLEIAVEIDQLALPLREARLRFVEQLSSIVEVRGDFASAILEEGPDWLS